MLGGHGLEGTMANRDSQRQMQKAGGNRKVRPKEETRSPEGTYRGIARRKSGGRLSATVASP